MLSIIIPTKNEEEYLSILLESIKKQTVQPKEIIVADAASDDKTQEIARSYGCKVVDGGMPGPGRNRGAEVAKGDLLLFLDADVELLNPRFLEDAMNEMRERELDFASCDIKPINGSFGDRILHKVYNWYVRRLEKIHPHALGFCLFANRKKHEQINGFDETVVFCEDHDYGLRARKVGTFAYLNSVNIPVSTRRLSRDGRFEIGIKYVLAEFYIMLIGPIRSNIFNYTFGHKKK